MNQKSKFFKFIIISIACFLIFLIQRQNFIKPDFIDEQDNFVVAKNLINGNKIYTNIFSHHQPGAYLLSGLIQKISQPNSIQILVMRHRQFIFLWSVFWFFFLVYKFGFRLFWPVFILELIKPIYLGNLFLSESLILYPTIYLVLNTFPGKNHRYNSFFLGIITAFIAINLAPMWPLLIITSLIFLKKWKQTTARWYFIIGGLIILLITCLCINIPGYFQNAILINQKFYIPTAGGSNLFLSFLKAIISPFSYIKNGLNVPEALIIKLIILAFLFYLLLYFHKTKKWVLIFQIFIILALSNLRNFELEKIFYDGFHLLIWVGLLTSLFFYLIPFKFQFIGLFFLLFLINFQRSLLTTKPNYSQDFEIYYSRTFNMSQAIRETKNNHDTLISMPDVALTYWQSQIQPCGRFIFFYQWMSDVSQLKNEQLSYFNSQPEYLIIKGTSGLNLSEYLKNYTNFSYRDSDKSEFFIRSDIYNLFSPEKISRLHYYGLKAISNFSSQASTKE